MSTTVSNIVYHCIWCCLPLYPILSTTVSDVVSPVVLAGLLSERETDTPDLGNSARLWTRKQPENAGGRLGPTIDTISTSIGAFTRSFPTRSPAPWLSRDFCDSVGIYLSVLQTNCCFIFPGSEGLSVDHVQRLRRRYYVKTGEHSVKYETTLFLIPHSCCTSVIVTPTNTLDIVYYIPNTISPIL